VPSWLCWPLVWLCGGIGLVPLVESTVPLWLSSDGGLAQASILAGLVLLDGAAVVGGSVGVRWSSGRRDGGNLHGGRCCVFRGHKGGCLAAWHAPSVASLVEGTECGGVYLSEVRNLSSLAGSWSWSGFCWVVTLITVGDGWAGLLGVAVELPFSRVRACWVRLSIRRKPCPTVYVGAGNDDTLRCRLPFWRRCCVAFVVPLEALWVKTQFW
jgi:hypothetical protein